MVIACPAPPGTACMALASVLGSALPHASDAQHVTPTAK